MIVYYLQVGPALRRQGTSHLLTAFFFFRAWHLFFGQLLRVIVLSVIFSVVNDNAVDKIFKDFDLEVDQEIQSFGKQKLLLMSTTMMQPQWALTLEEIFIDNLQKHSELLAIIIIFSSLLAYCKEATELIKKVLKCLTLLAAPLSG